MPAVCRVGRTSYACSPRARSAPSRSPSFGSPRHGVGPLPSNVALFHAHHGCFQQNPGGAIKTSGRLLDRIGLRQRRPPGFSFPHPQRSGENRITRPRGASRFPERLVRRESVGEAFAGAPRRIKGARDWQQSDLCVRAGSPRPDGPPGSDGGRSNTSSRFAASISSWIPFETCQPPVPDQTDRP
jgi:hypothetical protein